MLTEKLCTLFLPDFLFTLNENVFFPFSVYCPNPGTISNGKIHKKGQIGKFEFKAYIVTIRHGDRLSYECDRGYELLGPSGATCVDGQWSPEERPICKRSSHPALQKLWKPIEEGPSNY